MINATWNNGQYEAHLPESGEHITSSDPVMLGDIWRTDSGDEINTPEFHDTTIRLVGGSLDGKVVG